MRGFLAFLFLGLVALGAGSMGYNIGVSQAATAAAGGTVAVAGGWHLLGGLLLLPFALFLFPLFLFTFFGFLAFAFGPRRRFGRGPWRHDQSFGSMSGTGGFGPMSGHGFDARRQWVADAHRRMHEEEARTASGSSTTGSAGTTSSGPTAG